jgi:hypothetical protein
MVFLGEFIKRVRASGVQLGDATGAIRWAGQACSPAQQQTSGMSALNGRQRSPAARRSWFGFVQENARTNLGVDYLATNNILKPHGAEK